MSNTVEPMESSPKDYVRPDTQKQHHQDGDVVYDGDTLVSYHPYNPVNRQITEEEVKHILVRYGLPPTVHTLSLYQRAFVHQSYVVREELKPMLCDIPHGCLPLRSKSNERLEFLGDGVLEFVVKYYLYRRFPRANEGFMTEKKIALVKNETIGKLAQDMGLPRWMQLSRGAEEHGMRTNVKKLGCLFEAFVGALFLDFNRIQIKDEHGWFGTEEGDDDNASASSASYFMSGPGFQASQRFIESVLHTHIDWETILHKDENYKNILQVTIQQTFSVTPVYRILRKEEGVFVMGVFLCLGQEHHKKKTHEAVDYAKAYDSLTTIRDKYARAESGAVETGYTPQEIMLHKWKPAWIFLGKGSHRVKKKAEQLACLEALNRIHKST